MQYNIPAAKSAYDTVMSVMNTTEGNTKMAMNEKL